MAKISNRNDFRDYVLRRLGYPVIEINVDDDQIEDRIDDGLQLFREYAADGQLRVFQPVLITQAMVDAKSIDLNAALPAVANRILDVVKVFMIGDSTSNVNFFDIKYQMRLNDLADLATGVGDLAYYEHMQQYLSMIDLKLTGQPQIQFSRHSGTLNIAGDLRDGGDIKVGDYIMLEMFVEEAESVGGVYNNLFMKNYVTAILKKQWGENISKFEGMTLPGGVTLNGRQLIDDAKEEIEREIEKLRNEYDNPPNFFVG
jgi:hypothetical protein|tara:strand:- start:667 stop:1440 length:774 start_codon:yes stop_codon:yes gene_type:complete